MSSKDRKKQQSAVDKMEVPQQNIEKLRTEMIVPTTQYMSNNYGQAAESAKKDYGDIMGEYKNTLSKIDALNPTNVQADIVNYSRSPEMQKAMSGYSEFADTGGYSADNIRDMRARGVSPIRAAYQNALNDMSRRVNVQGGYAPNFGVLRAKMARESGQMMTDANQNINAGIAEAQNRGRQFGISGLGTLSTADTGFSQQAALANQSAKLQAAGINASPYSPMNQRLGALSGMASLYSATPGQASTFGNQLLGSTQNWLGVQNQENELAKARVGAQSSVAAIPTGFQAALNNAGKISQIGANVASIPWGGMNPTSLAGDVANPQFNRPPGM